MLFCVKLWDVESAGEAIRPLVGPETGVIPLQNGIDASDRLSPILGARAVMGGVAQISATIAEPGVIRQTGTMQRMIFGELDGSLSARAKRWSWPGFVDIFSFEKEVPPMPKSHCPYAPEFRRQMIELVRSGRTPEDLSREFEPTAQAIWNWVRQADRDESRKPDGAASAEREELSRLRRENRVLRQERDILAKAAAWFARETSVIPSGSSHSGKRTRPFSRLPRWLACSAFPPRVIMRGCGVRDRPVPRRTPRC